MGQYAKHVEEWFDARKRHDEAVDKGDRKGEVLAREDLARTAPKVANGTPIDTEDHDAKKRVDDALAADERTPSKPVHEIPLK